MYTCREIITGRPPNNVNLIISPLAKCVVIGPSPKSLHRVDATAMYMWLYVTIYYYCTLHA
jgi:hypothetical protein